MTTQHADPMAEANELLQGGVPAAKFPTLGTTMEGVVVTARRAQQTDAKTGEPLFWKDGQPREQVIVTIQTNEQEDESDTGERRLFVKGQMQAELRRAIAAAGEHGLAPGGTIKVQYYADGDAPARGLNAQKLYRVKYTPPAEISEGDWPDDDPGPAVDPDDLPF